MSTRKNFWQLALLLSLAAVPAACGDSSDGGNGDDPPVLGDGDDDGSPGDGDGSPEDGDADGSPEDGDADGSPGDGDADGDDGCLDNPTTNDELLNSCPPEGVERRTFDNDARLPANYTPGEPLPELP